jgi:hypothetical protein
MNRRISLLGIGLLALLAVTMRPAPAVAHCDGLDGPVVTDARQALETDEVELVLRWVRPQDEAEVREAYQQAQAVRELGPEARALADRYFFETVVRLHRAGEGAPYTGLAPAGRDLGPAIPAADAAVASGNVDEVEAMLLEAVRRGLVERFAAVQQSKLSAEQSVEAGRAYVHDYVQFVHYVEGVHHLAAGTHGPSGEHEMQRTPH